MQYIRNFSIIAHIDHGKSTLADRLLELTGAVEARRMRAQILDTMDLERERGITIKLQPARMNYRGYTLNLIDTPGHVDFSYEVSRALAAVEGVLLLVDATRGVQAQTIANLRLAQKQNLTIIPVVNKIDLPAADPKRVAAELKELFHFDDDELIFCSAKTGEGVSKVLEAVISRIPAPTGRPKGELRALIFDSFFDPHRGVVVYTRIVDGGLTRGQKIRLVSTNQPALAQEIGYLMLGLHPKPTLSTGEIGYLVTGLKTTEQARVGDTIAPPDGQMPPLAGYQTPKPPVFANIFPTSADQYPNLRQAIGKLKLNDASLAYEPISSKAFGFGFRLGLLGLLHLEIVKERLEREYDLSLVITTPTVEYRRREKGFEEPWTKIEILTPGSYIGKIMDLCRTKRAIMGKVDYLGELRLLHYEMPLSELIENFYDQLKSISSGFASLNYEVIGFRPADLVELIIALNDEPAEALTRLVPRLQADKIGRRLVERLKELLPRQNIEIRIQAKIGSRVIAAERIAPLRKDVTAKLYGGDITRKRKLLERQAKGKKKMARVGRVDVPSDVFVKLFGQN